MSAAYQRVTADGVIGVSGAAKIVYGVHMASGGAAGTVILRNGTSTSDTAVFNFVGTADDGSYFNLGPGVVFPSGVYYDEDANVSHAVIIYREL